MSGIELKLVSFEQDADATTDQMLFQDNKTWSKGRLKRAKVMSMITGNRQPSRKKIFSEIRNSEDIQIWNIDVQGKSMRCAKVHNLEVLRPGSSTWNELAEIQRLEIEDPEATLSTIPRQIVTELRQLESLSVTWTKIKSLPPGLFHLPLASLYLQRNQIKTLSGIERASQLTILDISNNRLDCLPKTFGQLRSLMTLNLSGNGLRELPESIGSLHRLRMLDCSCNKLKSLPNSLGNMIDLASLDVSSNQLTSLPESIGSLPNLADLRVNCNQLASLPGSFDQLNRLNSLMLRNNKFEDVPAQLSSLTNLQSLNMRENTIRHVENPITSLRYLILDQNFLQQIDVGILQCSNLQYLSLKSNKLVDVPGSISKLANIRSLNLSDNDIDEIPADLHRLTHLRHLALSCTKITTIPISVARMQSLTTLELENCDKLDCYLSIAYKSGGLRGVIDHLENERSEEEPPTNAVVYRISRGDSKTRSQVVTMYPDGDVLGTASENQAVLRKDAVESMYPGTVDAAPASEPEATLQVDSETRTAAAKPVPMARQSRCRPDRPPKSKKPPITLAASRQDHSETVEAITESPTGVDDADATVTVPPMADSTSSSRKPTAETSSQQQESSQSDEQTQRDTAAVDQKRDQPNNVVQGAGSAPTASASAKPAVSAKPRPPVKKKPARDSTNM